METRASVLDSWQVKFLSMGGALTSVETGADAVVINPAGLRPSPCHKLGSIQIKAEPLLTLAVASSGMDGFTKGEKGVLLASTLFRSLSMSRRSVAVAFLFAQRSLDVDSRRLIPSSPYREGYFSSIAVRANLAREVSLGASATLYRVRNDTELRSLGGMSFGMLLHPSAKVGAGLTYVVIPAAAAGLREKWEGLSDDTVNGGISWRATQRLLFSFDLRDMVEKSRKTALRPHLGIEAILGSSFVVRAGYFRDSGKKDVYCLGAEFSLFQNCSAPSFYKTPAGLAARYSVVGVEGTIIQVIGVELEF